MYELLVEETFDAAHALRGYEGPCENLHGHTFRVQVLIQGEKLNKLGLLEDFKSIKIILRTVLNSYDHKHLNEIPPFDQQNPSSENLARVIYEQLKKKLAAVTKVSVFESATSCASYWV